MSHLAGLLTQALDMTRTHHCSELNSAHVGHNVSLAGWVDTIRDHGGIVFIDLRDRLGMTQIMCEPENPDYKELLDTIRPESVIGVEGEVVARSAETINVNMATGQIEVQAKKIVIHNLSETPPFPMEDDKAEKVNEDLRLTYRYLDLRRPGMYRNLHTRHKATQAARRYLDEQGFLEVETPMLFKSTPEGAREYLVPSRLNPGEFYALPQSPQQYKQMLMVAGIERYYQIARCFRDEDLRADRQPEFSQIDIEISFIDRNGMYAIMEGMLKAIWKETLGLDIPTPFPRLSYQEVMNRYGSDKPDTRYDLEIHDFTEEFKDTKFKVFANVIADGGVVKAFNAKGLGDATQGEMKNLEEVAKSLGAKGLAFIRVQNGEWKSPILKFLSDEEQEVLKTRLHIEDGDMVFFAATAWLRACDILGRIRIESAKLLAGRGRLSIPQDQYNFLWVVDFPLMIYDEELGRHVAAHHPFTAPVEDDIHLLEKDPHSVRSKAYDCVLNGSEIGGGSIRIHQPALQQKIFEDVLKIPPEVAQTRFGYMLQAFKFGAPPHGGIAFGLDRICAILSNRMSIRDVIAFPKTQRGQCLMTESPSAPTEKQLRDLHIRVVDPGA